MLSVYVLSVFFVVVKLVYVNEKQLCLMHMILNIYIYMIIYFSSKMFYKY